VAEAKLVDVVFRGGAPPRAVAAGGAGGKKGDGAAKGGGGKKKGGGKRKGGGKKKGGSTERLMEAADRPQRGIVLELRPAGGGAVL